LLAEEILAESKEVEEETENLANNSGTEDELNFPLFPPMMNIELLKVRKRPTSSCIPFFCPFVSTVSFIRLQSYDFGIYNYNASVVVG
jgi:hypothetical protein